MGSKFGEVVPSRSDEYFQRWAQSTKSFSIASRWLLLNTAVTRRRSSLRYLETALAGLLERLDADLPLAILLVVRTVEGGPRVQVYRARVLDELATVLDRGALETPEGVVCPTRPVAVALVEQLLTLVRDRLLKTNTHSRLLELHPLLMSIALATYLGTDAAAEALARPPACSHGEVDVAELKGQRSSSNQSCPARFIP